VIVPKQVIRTKRKSIALIINSSGELIVRAPYVVGDSEIRAFVEKKQMWIKKKCSAVKAFDEKHLSMTIAAGETLVFLGNEYIIDILDGKQIVLDGNKILIPDDKNSKEMVVDWLREKAIILLLKRTDKYAKVMGVEPGRIKISEAKTRWGSCSYNNNLSFAWRLVMCPYSVIDYVVVHELCHIEHKNHSKDFWLSVKSILPTYTEQKNWLKTNRKLMEMI